MGFPADKEFSKTSDAKSLRRMYICGRTCSGQRPGAVRSEDGAERLNQEVEFDEKTDSPLPVSACFRRDAGHRPSRIRSGFDANKPVNFGDGHEDGMDQAPWLHVDVKKADGPPRTGQSKPDANVLFRRRFTKESLLPGTEIVVDGYQEKDGSHRANGRNLTLPNGKMLFLGSSGTGAPNELTPENQKK